MRPHKLNKKTLPGFVENVVHGRPDDLYASIAPQIRARDIKRKNILISSDFLF